MESEKKEMYSVCWLLKNFSPYWLKLLLESIDLWRTKWQYNANVILWISDLTWTLNNDLIKVWIVILYEAGPSWSYTPCTRQEIIFISEQEKIFFVHFRQTLCHESDHEEHTSKLLHSHIPITTWWDLKQRSVTIHYDSPLQVSTPPHQNWVSVTRMCCYWPAKMDHLFSQEGA